MPRDDGRWARRTAGHDVSATTSGGICRPSGLGNDWDWTGVGTVVSGCGYNATSRDFNAAEADGTYANVCIAGSNVQGGWSSCDYYGTPAKGDGVVDGYVTVKSGDAIPAVQITAARTHTGGAVTGSDGFYAIHLKAGSYKIVPSGRPTMKPAPTHDPKENDTTVSDDTTGTANFTLHAEIRLKLLFDESSAEANGLTVVNDTITTTEFGQPLDNVAVLLSPMALMTRDEAVTKAPLASVCSNGTRLWPTSTTNIPSGSDITINTACTGAYLFAASVGTTPGTWSLDARAYNSNEKLSCDATIASQTESITFTRENQTPLNGFVRQSDDSENQYPTLAAAGANASPLVNALALATSKGPSSGRLEGPGYSLVNAPDGQSMLIFPQKDSPIISSKGRIEPSVGTIGTDLVYDPARWSYLGAGAEGVADTLGDGAIRGLSTLKEFDAGTMTIGWNLKSHRTITSFNTTTFEYLGYGYRDIAEPGACY